MEDKKARLEDMTQRDYEMNAEVFEEVIKNAAFSKEQRHLALDFLKAVLRKMDKYEGRNHACS